MQWGQIQESRARDVGNPDKRRTMAKTTTDSQLRGLCHSQTDCVHLRGMEWYIQLNDKVKEGSESGGEFNMDWEMRDL